MLNLWGENSINNNIDKKTHPIIIIFDFDGVLLNSIGATVAIEQMMQDPYYEWDFNELKKIKPLDIIKRFEKYDTPSNYSTIKKFYKNFSDILPGRYKRLRFFQRIYRNLRKFEYEFGDFLPGTKQIISKLYASNFVLGICTNSQKTRVNYWLKRKSIYKFIQSIISRNDKSTYGIKPDPRTVLALIVKLKRKNNFGRIYKNRVFFVGDNLNDIKTARNAGIRSIAVLSGHATKSEFFKIKPDYMIESLNSILEIPEIKKEIENL